MKRERESTDSITHLVKIVAGEVFDERMKDNAIYAFDMEAAEDKVLSSLLGRIRSSLANSGTAWHSEEDFLLVQEVKIAVAQIAKNHNRSKGSITARIQQRELI